jgi:hypothetical protein
MTTITRNFITAGDATFTIETPNDGHMTFRVQHVPASGQYAESYFVKTLTGPCNESDFTYIGKLNLFTGQVETTRKSEKWNGTLRLRLLNRILCRIWGNEHASFEQHGYRVHHEGRCCRCNRKLTTPASVESGIGPECAKMAGLMQAA